MGKRRQAGADRKQEQQREVKEQPPVARSQFKWNWSFKVDWVGPLLGLLIILVPVFWYGPWLPLTDMVAYASLNSYPPQLSYGPNHYYVMQLTYVLPLIFSRVCVDLGIAVAYQVVLLYLIHAVSYFLIIWFFLRRFISNPHVRNGAIVLGTLAFWDGQFLWGGPLAYSLGAVLIAWAVYVSMEEAERPETNQSGLVLLLVLAAVLSHPFAIPFSLALYLMRLIFIKPRRLNSIIAIGILLIYQVIIRNESPEQISGPILSRLFSWYPEDFSTRLSEIFLLNPFLNLYLFGIDPLSLRLYYYLLAFVQLTGFVTSPLAFWVSRGKPGRQFFFALSTLAGVLYFWSKTDNDLIWWWPQRILTMYSTVNYVAGIVAPLALLAWVQERVPAMRFRFNNFLWAGNWLLIAAATFVLVCSEVSIFQMSGRFFSTYAELKQQVLSSHNENKELQFKGSNVEPWCLRAVPFILFSDPDIIQHNILISTEWHQHLRHPTRINPYNPLPKVPIGFFNKEAPPQPPPMPRAQPRDSLLLGPSIK